MFWQRRLYQHPEFKLGVRDLAPQAFGQIAWALMTGVALVKSGMSVFESVFMTLVVYAGSSQLATMSGVAANCELPAYTISVMNTASNTLMPDLTKATPVIKAHAICPKACGARSRTPSLNSGC